MKISKNPFAMLPLLAVLVSCEKAVINTMVLSYSNRRELQETCPAGFTFNTCANCCGYKFTAKTALQTAVTAYSQDKTTAVNTYGEMKCWDVSLITDMSYLFSSKSLNEPIGCWNVGSVTYMYAMFYGATNFNQPIGNWNVGSVTDMDAMFALATNFNQPIGNWNVGSVTTMAFMFYDAAKFNQDLCSWYKKLPPSTTAFTNIFLGTSCPNNAIPDLQVKASFCRTCPTNNGGVQGDPHFKTWHGDHFSYHGECDLVLMKNDQFSDGEGLLIHVRTKIEKTWSYVKNAAVKIGNDILEIEGKGQVWDKSADAVHIINGEVNADLPLLLATKFPVTKIEERQCDTQGGKCIEAIVYKIDLGGGDNILITQKWGVIKVSVTAKDKDKFQDSIGLMGHFDKPGFLGRDGIHKITDFNQFGQEWQVLQSEPMIFNERRAPQHPEQCTLPTLTTKRRLGEDAALFHMAEEACAGVEEESKEFCIFDVTAAGTKEAASTYFTAYVG